MEYSITNKEPKKSRGITQILLYLNVGETASFTHDNPQSIYSTANKVKRDYGMKFKTKIIDKCNVNVTRII